MPRPEPKLMTWKPPLSVTVGPFQPNAAAKPPAVTEEQVAALSALLKNHEPARANFLAMSPSVKRTYARAYFDAKTEEGRGRRLSWMVERLNQNLKPM